MFIVALCLTAAGATTTRVPAAVHTFYHPHNLVADEPGVAPNTDPNLVNPWGIVPNPTGFWWVADNATGLSTLYDGDGEIQSLVVSVPGASGPGRPTGIVFNGTTDFVVTDGTDSGVAAFIFASEDGTISGWAPAVPPPPPSTQAHVAVDNSDDEAIYKGLALASHNGENFLYATDFHNRRIDVFDGEFQPVDMPGNFHDSQIPDNFAPFGIATIGNRLYVTYAMQDEEGEDDVPGKHRGFVNVFDAEGHLLDRLIRRGRLDAPWGLALAPDNFGEFSGMLLVGNFGDGRINAYDPQTGHWRGQLRRSPGHPIEIEGLWGIAFGNGGDAGPTNVLFFAAGPDDEEHGLFGRINPVGIAGP